MRLLVYAFIILIITACKNYAVAKKLSGADSLVITFNIPNSDSVVKTVSTTENNAINKIVDFIDGKPAKEFKCGYDGNLIFFSKGQVLLLESLEEGKIFY